MWYIYDFLKLSLTRIKHRNNLFSYKAHTPESHTYFVISKSSSNSKLVLSFVLLYIFQNQTFLGLVLYIFQNQTFLGLVLLYIFQTKRF